MNTDSVDRHYMDHAITLAEHAETHGNLPIACVLVLNGVIIAEGTNASLHPAFSPLRHAEMEALAKLEPGHQRQIKEVTCYTTLEPCAMCFAALVIHGVGRIVYGAHDPKGGGLVMAPHLPAIYRRLHRVPQISGPLNSKVCDPLYERALARLITASKAAHSGE